MRIAMGLTTRDMTNLDNSSEEHMVQHYDQTSKYNGVQVSSGSMETVGKDPAEIRVTTAYDVSR